MRKKKKGRALLGLIMVLTMSFGSFIGIVPEMSITAHAEEVTFSPASAYTEYENLIKSDTTVKIDGVQYNGTDVDWFVIGYDSTEKVVTLLSKQYIGYRAFNADHSKGNAYAGSYVKTYVEGLTDEGQPLAGIKDALVDISGKVTGDPNAISGAVPYLLSTTEAGELSSAQKSSTGYWWLRSPGGDASDAAFVYGNNGLVYDNGLDIGNVFGVRPALKLNLESVIFSSESKTFTAGSAAAHSVIITPGSNMTKTEASGAAAQTVLAGAMTAVVYTANDGCYFPENYSVESVNGISVTRDSYTQITVSGTPSADTEITLNAPTKKITPDAPVTAAAVNCSTTSNNDGKLTGVTKDMEYKKSEVNDWTAGTGSDITGLAPGTYYVRVKATDTTNASGNQVLSIARYEEPEQPGDKSVRLEKQRNGTYRYTKDGSWQDSYTGLVCIEDIWYYVEDGLWITDKYAFVDYEGYRFIVANGVVACINGLVMDPDSDNWYFCAEGQVVKHTGLVMYDEEWFYVEDGVLDTGRNGLVEYNGGLFYVAAGRLIRDVNGLVMDPNSPDWYFIALGEVQVQHTGLVMYDGEWFYVEHGKLATDYIGEAEYDGQIFNVVNGMVR